ncbi:MAG: DUF4318 domain-containing protein, partial [Romboutsia sp.]|uniref:DUF4318 domain-containing protein n=1 Tax=Romboutsia sp. TaxID=1965302 RepID=UPI003F2AABC6
MGKILKKAFDIELDDALSYPSAKTICETISKKESNIEFINKEKSISFKQQNTRYEVEVKMARG